MVATPGHRCEQLQLQLCGAGRTAPAVAHQISKIYYTLLPSVINVSRDMKEVFHKNIGNKKM